MGKLAVLLLIIFGWLQYSLWLGKNGLYDLIRIKNHIAIQKSKNIQLKARNSQLFSKINKFNNQGQEFIEERSRNELGMIKSGETFYRLVPITQNN
ncbi:cell division protein FtsB [Sodalis sp. CWE]|uniref:cell division protein FtsB n=1 Tax=Sodalis sp. CWE TaxID=2803816 RepID=UPI001C7D9C16|nr:cell division protein FtsB [Sodalis sp. CWE]MBX4180988.1 cell division protein FtsB [Sodalis sp. CWE]